MSRGVRFYTSKRWCHECQTEIDVEIKEIKDRGEETKRVPMGFDILSALRFVIPPERAYTVKPGNLYVRCHNGGKEFVRKRQRVSWCKDAMGKKCSHEHDGWCTHESVLMRQYATLAERRRCLEAEQARIEEREIQRRIGIRDRRPYHITIERDDTTPPPNTAAEIAPEYCRRRRVSFARDESPPPHHRGSWRQRHQQHRRPCHYFTDHGHPHACHTPRPDFYVREIQPPFSYQHHERRPSRIISNNVYHNDVPVLCSRVITGGRRKSNSDGGWRTPRRNSCRYADIRYESRDPEDYYC